MCGFYRHSYDLSFGRNECHLCDNCKEFNSNMRTKTRDLAGKVAIVTGARIKIGFETARILLDNGCVVVATTRFPANAYSRFKKCEMFDSWKHNLYIYPLNLKDGASILSFCQYINSNFSKVDFLINK